MRITRNVVWPGKGGGRHGKWDDLKLAILDTALGDAIQVDFETYDEVDSASRAVQKYAHETLHSRDEGWEVGTSKRGRVLFLLKRPV